MAGVQPLSNDCRSVDVCFLQTAWVNMNMCLPDSTPCLTNQLFLQHLQKDSTCACRFVLFFTVLCLAYRFVSIGHVLCLLCCMVFMPFCVSVQLWYGVLPEALPHYISCLARS